MRTKYLSLLGVLAFLGLTCPNKSHAAYACKTDPISIYETCEPEELRRPMDPVGNLQPCLDIALANCKNKDMLINICAVPVQEAVNSVANYVCTMKGPDSPECIKAFDVARSCTLNPYLKNLPYSKYNYNTLSDSTLRGR